MNTITSVKGLHILLQVSFSRLCVKKDTMKKIQESQGSVKLKEEERPVLHYSKWYNYLKHDDRKEIAKALLTLTILETRARIIRQAPLYSL
jgi:hypothetical protein